MLDFRKIVGQIHSSPALDSTTPWYEFLSHLECCESLGITPKLSRFLRYQRYYQSLIKK